MRIFNESMLSDKLTTADADGGYVYCMLMHVRSTAAGPGPAGALQFQ